MHNLVFMIQHITGSYLHTYIHNIPASHAVGNPRVALVINQEDFPHLQKHKLKCQNCHKLTDFLPAGNQPKTTGAEIDSHPC